jgi:hypothetical protein
VLAGVVQIEDKPLFEFESSDSLAQFLVWMTPVAGSGVIATMLWGIGGLAAVAALGVFGLLLLAGLRSSITVQPARVTIRRKWFFVPYGTHVAPCIEDVAFGGNDGLADGAMGVVISMGGRDFHFGTSKNMHYLHETLTQVARGGKCHEG